MGKMPPKKKEQTEEKIIIKRFKDGSSEFFVNNKHYRLDENNEIHFVAGGFYEEECVEALRAYCKRNKVSFVPREKSRLDEVEKEFNSVFSFGRHNGKSVQTVYYEERKYLEWCLKDYSFSPQQEKLKKEIEEILKL